jgi:TatD DNase family protein
LHDEEATIQKLALVDSHCHIGMTEFDSDREAVVDRGREAGVATMLIVGCADAEQGHRRAVQVAESLGLPVAAGVHPHDARLASEALFEEIAGWAREGRLAALGEIGLDFHYDHSPRPVQEEVFRRQVRLARELRLPVVVHTREADAETARLLEEEDAGDVGGILHCFTGGTELARRVLDLGFLVSFSGIVAFPRAEVIQEVASTIPLDRLLVETDAPFLAPPPHRGKRNEPAFVVEVARKIARLRGVSEEEIGVAVTRNFERLITIDKRDRIRHR